MCPIIVPTAERSINKTGVIHLLMAEFAPEKPASMANTLEKLKILSVASWCFAGFM